MEYYERSKVLLRVAMSLVFLYFGFQQVSNPDSWTGFIPSYVNIPNVTANNIVMFNGVSELVLGIFLLIGLYTRFSAAILSLHLFGIAFSMGLTPLAVRDLGLAIATLTVFLNGADSYTIDAKFAHKKLGTEKK